MSILIQKPIPEHLQPQMIGGLTLKPSHSCKTKTAVDIAEKIFAYPKQELKNFGVNSALTFVDKAELDDDRQDEHTLFELYELECVNHFFIYTKNHGVIVVERLTNGDFMVTDGFKENEILGSRTSNGVCDGIG